MTASICMAVAAGAALPPHLLGGAPSEWMGHPLTFGGEWLALAFAAFYGATCGSFLNVCIYRWAVGRSVRSPGSQCPICHRALPWYENLPVIGWLWLRGRCRGCREPISVQYPLVEAGVALWWVGGVWLGGLHVLVIAVLIGSSMLAGAVVTVWRYRVWPLSYAGIGAVLNLAMSAIIVLAPAWLSATTWPWWWAASGVACALVTGRALTYWSHLRPGSSGGHFN